MAGVSGEATETRIFRRLLRGDDTTLNPSSEDIKIKQFEFFFFSEHRPNGTALKKQLE